MGAITLDGILRAEHDIILEACGNTTSSDMKAESFDYIFGVCDMAQQLIKKIEGNNGADD